MIVVDERDIIDALNRAQDDEMVADLMRRTGRDLLLERGFALLASDECGSLSKRRGEAVRSVTSSLPPVPTTSDAPVNLPPVTERKESEDGT